MNKSTNLFFIALLPPQAIQDYANSIKQHFAEKYSCYHAMKSPPHITLQPPFEWHQENLPALAECLSDFAKSHANIPVKLSGFGAFPRRVIYINVVKTPELIKLQFDLMAYLENGLGIVDAKSKERAFAPHMTVAFKDLTPPKFKLAWPEFQHQELQFDFTVNQITLLMHDGQRWQINSEFDLL